MWNFRLVNRFAQNILWVLNWYQDLCKITFSLVLHFLFYRIVLFQFFCNPIMHQENPWIYSNNLTHKVIKAIRDLSMQIAIQYIWMNWINTNLSMYPKIIEKNNFKCNHCILKISPVKKLNFRLSVIECKVEKQDFSV